MNILLVAIGGFFGTIARYSVTRSLTRNFSGTFPHATFFVNGLGSFLFGVMFGLHISTTINLLFGVGFLGAFTTFATINAELVQFKQERNWVFFLNYMIVTYLFGIAVAFAGFMSSSLMLELKLHSQHMYFMLK